MVITTGRGFDGRLAAMAWANHGGIDLWYETSGDPNDGLFLLLNGVTSEGAPT